MRYWSLHGTWLQKSIRTPEKLLGNWEAARSRSADLVGRVIPAMRA
jgi:hypothetical protein